MPKIVGQILYAHRLVCANPRFHQQPYNFIPDLLPLPVPGLRVEVLRREGAVTFWRLRNA
jgi:hypothetical protein